MSASRPHPLGQNAMERRWGNRVPVDESVCIKRENATVGFASLSEVSLSGGFLRTRWRLPNLSRVHVELPDVMKDAGTSGHIEAFIVRQTTEGLGLEWCEFAPPSIARLIETHSRNYPRTQQLPASTPATRRMR